MDIAVWKRRWKYCWYVWKWFMVQLPPTLPKPSWVDCDKLFFLDIQHRLCLNRLVPKEVKLTFKKFKIFKKKKFQTWFLTLPKGSWTVRQLKKIIDNFKMAMPQIINLAIFSNIFVIAQVISGPLIYLNLKTI